PANPDRYANCFAQAIGGIALFSEWGLDSGVVFNGSHAHIVIGDGKDIRFVDPWELGVMNVSQESAKIHSASAIDKLYKSKLPRALKSQDFVHYYFQPSGGGGDKWKLHKSSKIHGITSKLGY